MLSNTTPAQAQTIRRTFKNHYWAYLVTLVVYGLDQLSKYTIEQTLGPYRSGKEAVIFGGLTFDYVKNSGASYNFLRDVPWLFTIIAILAALGLIAYYYFQRVNQFWYQASIGLILGGIVGNLSDRIFKEGFVTDFIHVSWLPFFNVFNLADSAISIGVVIVLLTTLLQTTKTQAAKSDSPAETK